MKHLIIPFFLFTSMITAAQSQPEKFQSLPFGSIRPTGWLKAQMQKDINGFVGKLDLIVPDLMSDSIYGKSRLQKHSVAKDLGNLKSGDAEGDEQYKWWNSETQSNWWDGYLRNVFLLNDAAGIKKVRQYVNRILATQDDDGYIGIYDKELRYRFTSENGELWSKATLYRGLLAYYEYTQDTVVFNAIERAVDNVMKHYPINASSPFSSGNGFNGGVSHGLTFTDVLERMYYHTGNVQYRQYALFLYRDFSNTYQSEADAQLKNILNPAYRLTAHGVHTYEHARALIIARYAADTDELKKALSTYLARISKATTISGGAIGDEWIAQRAADATHTGYEYCSLQELLDSYCLLLQKTGTAATGDAIENIFYNAAQGSRNPNASCIAYLKTDNSFEMMGTRNGEAEPDRKQTRYKYSPAHQDVAVCCNPNAGRISPYFIQHAWMKENENTLVAALLMPNTLSANLKDNAVTITTETEYPYANQFNFVITLHHATTFTLKIRKPAWVKNIQTKENFSVVDGYIVIQRNFAAQDNVAISFEADVETRSDSQGHHYFTHGALLYALPIAAKEIPGKTYIDGFTDLNYEPLHHTPFVFQKGAKLLYRNGTIITSLVDSGTKKPQQVTLVPFGKTILRQVTF